MNSGKDIGLFPSRPRGRHIGPVLDEEERTEVARVMRSDKTTQLSGEEVKRLEKCFAFYMGPKKTIVVNSCTNLGI